MMNWFMMRWLMPILECQDTETKTFWQMRCTSYLLLCNHRFKDPCVVSLVCLFVCVSVVDVHLIGNWSMLAEAPVRDPSPPQARGPNVAASFIQMDLTAGGCPREPSCPSPTDGVSQWGWHFTSVPIKAWLAWAVTFKCSRGEKDRVLLRVCFGVAGTRFHCQQRFYDTPGCFVMIECNFSVLI